MRRASAPRTNAPPAKRLSKCFTSQEQVYLERVLGYSLQSNAALALDGNSGLVAYPAGCVVVLFNTRRNKQSFIRNEETKAFTAVAFSRDGKLLATGECGYRPMVRVWSVEERCQQCYFAGHNFRIECVQFSPTGLYLVSVGSPEDHTVHVWDVRTPARLASSNITSKINAMAFSEDGQFFVTVGVRSIRFWYMDTSKVKMKETIPLQGRNAILREFIHSVFTDVACCTEGNNPTTSSTELSQTFTYALTQDGQLCKFNAQRNLLKWVNFKTPRATSLSLTEHYVLVGCAGGICIVFHTPTLNYITRLPFPHSLGVDLQEGGGIQQTTTYTSTTSVSAGGEETTLPTSSQHTSQPFSTHRREGATYPDVIAARYDHRHSRVVCCYGDHSMYVWDVRDIKHIQKHISHLYHSGPIWALEVLPVPHMQSSGATSAMFTSDIGSTDSGLTTSLSNKSWFTQQRSCFITGSDDDTLRVWSLPPQNTSTESTSGGAMRSPGLLDNPYSQDLKKIIYLDPYLTCLTGVEKHSAGHQSNMVTERGDETGRDLKPGVRAIAISPDCLHLAVGDKQGNVRIFLFDGFEELMNIPAHDSEVLCLHYFQSTSMPNLRLLCSSSRDRLIHVYDVSADYALVQTLDDHSGAVYAAKIVETGDGNIRLLSCGVDKSFLFHILKPDELMTSARFHLAYHLLGKNSQQDLCVTRANGSSLMSTVDPSNKSIPPSQHTLVAVAYQDRTVRVYNVMNGKLRRSMKASKAEEGTILRCTLDPTDTFIATTSSDKVIYLLDFRTGEIKAEFGGHSELILSIRFLSDLKRIVSISADGCIFVWRIPVHLSTQMRAAANHQHIHKQTLHTDKDACADASPLLSTGIPLPRAVPVVEMRDKTQATLTRENADPHANESFRFSVSALPEWAKKNFERRESLRLSIPPTTPPMGSTSETSEESPAVITPRAMEPEGDNLLRLMAAGVGPKVVAEDDPENVEEDADEEHSKCGLELESVHTFSTGDDEDDETCCTPVSEYGAHPIPPAIWSSATGMLVKSAAVVGSPNTQSLLEQLSTSVNLPVTTRSGSTDALSLGEGFPGPVVTTADTGPSTAGQPQVMGTNAECTPRKMLSSLSDELYDEENFLISPPSLMTNSAPCVLAEAMQRSRLHFHTHSDAITESTENVFDGEDNENRTPLEESPESMEKHLDIGGIQMEPGTSQLANPRTSLTARHFKRAQGAAFPKPRVCESSENLSRHRPVSLTRAAQDTRRRLHRMTATTPGMAKSSVSYGLMGPPLKSPLTSSQVKKEAMPSASITKRSSVTAITPRGTKAKGCKGETASSVTMYEKRSHLVAVGSSSRLISSSRMKSSQRMQTSSDAISTASSSKVRHPLSARAATTPVRPPLLHQLPSGTTASAMESPQVTPSTVASVLLGNVTTTFQESEITVHTASVVTDVAHHHHHPPRSGATARQRWKRDSCRTCPVDMDAYQQAVQLTRQSRLERMAEDLTAPVQVPFEEDFTAVTATANGGTEESELSTQSAEPASKVPPPIVPVVPSPTAASVSHILVREALEKMRHSPATIEGSKKCADESNPLTSASAEGRQMLYQCNKNMSSHSLKQSSREHVIDAEESGEDETQQKKKDHVVTPQAAVLPRKTGLHRRAGGSQGQLIDMAGLLDEILANHRHSGSTSRRPSSANVLGDPVSPGGASNNGGTYNVNSPVAGRLSQDGISSGGAPGSDDDKTPISLGRNSLPTALSTSVMMESSTTTLLDGNSGSLAHSSHHSMSCDQLLLPMSESLQHVAQQLNHLVNRCNHLDQLECERARLILLQELEPQFLALKVRLGLSLNLHVMGREHLESIIHEVSQYIRHATPNTVSRIPTTATSNSSSSSSSESSRRRRVAASAAAMASATTRQKEAEAE